MFRDLLQFSPHQNLMRDCLPKTMKYEKRIKYILLKQGKNFIGMVNLVVIIIHSSIC